MVRERELRGKGDVCGCALAIKRSVNTVVFSTHLTSLTRAHKLPCALGCALSLFSRPIPVAFRPSRNLAPQSSLLPVLNDACSPRRGQFTPAIVFGAEACLCCLELALMVTFGFRARTNLRLLAKSRLLYRVLYNRPCCGMLVRSSTVP